MECATLTTLANEEWRPVKGFDDHYMVSNLGRVISYGRWIFGKFHRYTTPLLLKQSLRNKYYTVRIGYKNKFVHRLVATAFVPNNNGYNMVNHINENKLDNRACNLEWCTTQYNNTYGTVSIRKAASHSKLIEQLTMDGKHIAFYENSIIASKENNGKFKPRNIRRAASGARNQAYGYKWRFV